MESLHFFVKNNGVEEDDVSPQEDQPLASVSCDDGEIVTEGVYPASDRPQISRALAKSSQNKTLQLAVSQCEGSPEPTTVSPHTSFSTLHNGVRKHIPILITIFRVAAAQAAKDMENRFLILGGRVQTTLNEEREGLMHLLQPITSGSANERVPLLGLVAKVEQRKGFPPLIPCPRNWQDVFVIFSCFAAAPIVAILTSWAFDVTFESAVQYLSIPLISAICTYLHIWLALWMTFYPVQFRGFCQLKGIFGRIPDQRNSQQNNSLPADFKLTYKEKFTAWWNSTFGNIGLLGWQGIVPFKGEKMARTAVRLMTHQLLDVREVFGRLDARCVAEELRPLISQMLYELVDDVALRFSPLLWRLLPQKVKNEVVLKINEEAPLVIAEMLNAVQNDIDNFLDIEEIVVRRVLKDPNILNQIFIQCGFEELTFIRNCGALMGFCFGLAQMFLWMVYQNKFVVFPVLGLLVGAVTNWLAITIIFSPVTPVTLSICGGSITISLQGLFLRRQEQVAVEYGRVVATELLDSVTLLQTFTTGPSSANLIDLVQKHVEAAVEQELQLINPLLRPLLHMSIEGGDVATMKRHVARRASEMIPASVPFLESYTAKTLDLEQTLAAGVGNLTPTEFEGLLHPVFQEDEWKLVLLGGILGVAIGYLQVAAM